jgi:hypothetical protein
MEDEDMNAMGNTNRDRAVDGGMFSRSTALLNFA